MEHSSRDPKSDQRQIQDEALRWVVRLHSGEADASEEHACALWRARNPAHDAAFREAQSLWSLGSGLTLDRRTGRAVAGRPMARRTSWRPLAAAAILLLALTGVAIHGGLLRTVLRDYATGTSEVRTVALPDGSTVTLNARSSIDVDFSATRRRIVLSEGQAYFEVAKDAARPFRVEARKAEVTALGTAFDVNIGADAEQVVVAVTQHAVEVVPHDGAQAWPHAPVRVPEGQSVTVEADGAIGAVTPADPQAVAGWRSGLLIAEAKPLREVAAGLQRYHSGWIVLSDRRVGDLSVSAVLDLKQPDESLDTLAAGLPIRVRHISPYLTLISAR